MFTISRPLIFVVIIVLAIAGAQHLCEATSHEKDAPLDIEAANEFAHTLCMANRYDEALAVYQKVLEKDPAAIYARYNIGNVLKLQGHIDQAVQVFKEIIDQTPDNCLIHQQARFSRGITYLTRGSSDTDWIKGWEEYEWRWDSIGMKEEQYNDIPFWKGSDLQGKTILVMDEQGLGDTFQFIRYVKCLKKRGAHVIVMCHPELKTFLQTACNYIDQLITDGDLLPSFDCQVHLLNLPHLFKTVEKTVPIDIPYLKADPALVRYWKQRLAADKNFKVGFCWRGNQKCSTQVVRQIVPNRAINLNQLLSKLSQIPGCSFYSLQKIEEEEQLQEIQNMPIHHFEDELDGAHGRFMDTAALIMNLDLVITIDTSIAHLAGALGVPTWILLPTPADWRWMMDRPDTPWYPNAHLFRQKEMGDWSYAMSAVAKELKKLVTAPASRNSVLMRGSGFALNWHYK